MKKTFLVISLITIFAIGGFSPVVAQDQPKPKKDTVNIDTDAKPTFYYAVEDEKSKGNSSGKSNAGIIVIIAGAVIDAGEVAFILLRKKK